MFIGIIQAVASVISVTKEKEILRIRLSKSPRTKTRLGESIAIDGVCSTVVAMGKGFFEVEYMPETLSKTTVGSLKKGHIVNIERSFRVGDSVDGHFVQGHVDTVAEIKSLKNAKGKCEVTLSLPSALKPYIALHGSVTVNGVSLTVARLTQSGFVIALIPYTLEHTNLGQLEKGGLVNIEVDSLARYVVSALKNMTHN